MRVAKFIAAFVGALLLQLPAHAQPYPAKPIRIVVAYPAGQGTDVATRFIAEHLSKSLGQAIVVDNRGGAGGNIGTEHVARSPGDGYTLTMGTNATHALNQFLYNSTGYDAEKDFEPIILIGTFPMALLANPATPFNSVGDVLNAVKTSPKGADVALPSTTARLVFELLKEQTQAPLFGVPYKGSPPAHSDLMGGQVPLLIDTIAATRALVTSGKMRAIAVTGAKQSALLPGVKTVAEQGVPGFEVIAWNALYAPKGTPAAIVRQLNAEVAKILAQPDVQQRLLQLGFEPAGGTPEQLAQFAQRERAKWGPVIKKAGLKAD